MTSFIWKIAMCNVRGMNNPAKQENIFHWHKESGSLILIVTETKLCSGSQSWIMKRFEGVWVFTSGLDVGFHGAGVAIFVNDSLGRHVSKVEEIKDADEKKWVHFKDLFKCVLLGSLDKFKMAEDSGNLDGMWEMLANVMTASADKIFSRHWYSEFDCAKNRLSSKFSRLELLVAKLLKVLRQDDTLGFDHLADSWFKVDPSEAFKVFGMVTDGVGSAGLISHLSKIRKQYRKFKYCESEVAKRFAIRDAIVKHMEKFKTDKGGMIRSILEQSFHKVVLDHLVVGDSLILEPEKVKLKVDDIMVNWTKKQNVLPVLSGPWAQQYAPLAYVNNSPFSLVMCDITMCEMSSVISNLPDGKAVGLSGITNELWKHTGCLAWVSMIPKPYDWDGILSNTHPIVLIETTRKILLKVLSDRISLACSRFDVLCGNNFSVFKGTSTQSPISAVGSIVEDVLEKGCKLWLVLQDMCKVYDSVSWPHLEASLR
ncbi:hypothetical protein G9A89_010714 [Geosiphon pyriformis]|nr:hypothetical protein G9A89_010714 [Geosiphon pyriformis]